MAKPLTRADNRIIPTVIRFCENSVYYMVKQCCLDLTRLVTRLMVSYRSDKNPKSALFYSALRNIQQV